MAVDFEEIYPQRFLVRNPMLRPLLKGEGELQGQWFTLTSWRLEGLLGRMRQKGFTALTLEERVARLPALPLPHPHGAPLTRPVARVDRYSRFNPHTLVWEAIPPEETSTGRSVTLHAGEVVRVRMGRGAARFYRVRAEHKHNAALSGLSETEALLQGYANVRQAGPLELQAIRMGDANLLPAIELPPPHRELMERIGQRQENQWRVEQAAWPLARAIYKHLGLVLYDRP